MENSKKKIREGYDNFFNRLIDKVHPEGMFFIEMAYNFSKEGHRTQIRRSGERYFEHPKACAIIIMDELKIYDYQMLCAILLHDIREETFFLSLRMIKHIFDQKICEYVDALTKKTPDEVVTNKRKRDLDYIRRIYFAEDRVIILKLVDRLHNMRTLSYFNKRKQIEITRETIEYFLPLAKVKNRYLYKELKNICMEYVKKYPKSFIDLLDNKGRILE